MATTERKLPVGIQSFKEIRKNGYLYVDKSDIIWYIANKDKKFNKETRILTPIHLADRLRPLCILASLQISNFHCLRFLPFCILTAF